MPLLRLTAISHQIAELTPGDTGEHREILTSLNEVRRSFPPQTDGRIVETLDGAILLMTFMLKAGEFGGLEILGVIVRMLEYVQSRLIQGTETEEPIASNLSLTGAAKFAREMQTGDLKVLGDMQLGEILVKLGHMHSSEINEALETSHALNILFGEAIVRNKAASESQVREALNHQELYRLRGHRASTQSIRNDKGNAPVVLRVSEGSDLERSAGLELLSDIMLGEILVRSGSITREALDFGLKCQRGSGQRLGETLVSNGVTTWNRIDKALEEQEMLRRPA